MSTADKDNNALCPACGRFIGPLDECPYCDAPANKPFSLRFLRYAALTLAVIGMAALYLAARAGRTPAVEITGITPALNSAVVRVTGTVAALPRTNHTGRAYVGFPITDGSNRLFIAAYGSCAAGIIAAGSVPRRGDRVEATGSVSIRSPGERRLLVECPEAVRIVAPARGSVPAPPRGEASPQ